MVLCEWGPWMRLGGLRQFFQHWNTAELKGWLDLTTTGGAGSVPARCQGASGCQSSSLRIHSAGAAHFAMPAFAGASGGRQQLRLQLSKLQLWCSCPLQCGCCRGCLSCAFRAWHMKNRS